jgi:hypothetical protein
MFWLRNRQPKKWRHRVDGPSVDTGEMLAALEAAGEGARLSQLDRARSTAAQAA